MIKPCNQYICAHFFTPCSHSLGHNRQSAPYFSLLLCYGLCQQSMFLLLLSFCFGVRSISSYNKPPMKVSRLPLDYSHDNLPGLWWWQWPELQKLRLQLEQSANLKKTPWIKHIMCTFELFKWPSSSSLRTDPLLVFRTSKSAVVAIIWHLKFWNAGRKYRKKCECCPSHYLITTPQCRPERW